MTADIEQQQGGVTLHDSIIDMGALYMELRTMGVDPENILDLIRIVFMFAGPSDPMKVAGMVADTGAKKN